MVNNYIPKKGDIIFVDFNPIKGHEQKGPRPAIVLSNEIYNKYTNMAIVCPITSNYKDFPIHYELKDSKKIKGVVLCEHIRSIDYNARKVSFVEKASELDIISIITLTCASID